jgi:C1A family cysteine protease
MDCAGKRYLNFGCNGGSHDRGIKWTRDHGSTTRAAYPYLAENGSCKTKEGEYHVNGVQKVEKTIDALKASLQEHVVSVSVDANPLKDYESGVLMVEDCPNKQINHDIAAVGYADNYFIIRNSWGAGWGEDGYVRME